MSENETADISERLEACQAANDCRLSLVQILREYDEFKRKVQPSQNRPYIKMNGAIARSRC